MESAAILGLAGRIFGSLAGAAGKAAWKRVRGERPVLNSVAKIACEALSASVLEATEGRSIRDEEVRHLAGLIDEAFDSGLLMDFVYQQRLAEFGQFTSTKFVEEVVDRLKDHGWVDLSTTSLPAEDVLGRFVVEFPKRIDKEASKHGSPLFGYTVIAHLNHIRDTLRGMKEGGDAQPRSANELLYEAVGHVESLNPARVPLGFATMRAIYGSSEDDAALVVAVTCGLLKRVGRIALDDLKDVGNYEAVEVELKLGDMLRSFLPAAHTGDRSWAVDLAGAELIELDLSGVDVGSLRLDKANIHGSLKIRNARVLGDVMMRHCSVDGIADFQGAEFCGLLSCADSYFSMLDFSQACVRDDCGFAGCVLDGASSFGGRSDDHPYVFRACAGEVAEFKRAASFQGAVIGESVELSGVKVGGECFFGDAHFEGVARLVQGHFLGGLDMQGASVVGELDMRGSHAFGDFNLRLAKCKRCSLDGVSLDEESPFYLANYLTTAPSVEIGMKRRILRSPQ
ncbi:pentapeptide repeat-containing protein [Streptomyces sp. bgisy153]|uniref:pentapeptide repeat-containing protein n=1 Tax=Streptomyces sp. bgisy153 TaxID=3413793 RepID=UPI003D72D277